MDRPPKQKTPNLSLIVPPNPSSKRNPATSRHVQLQSRALPTPNRSAALDGISPPKQKRLFPVACRLVPTDQWFTSRIDRTWNVLDLKIWLLSKALPVHFLPLPASYRPSSPVTFAAAPPPPPSRPPTSSSYHRSQTPTARHASSPVTSPPPPAFSPPMSPPTEVSSASASPTTSVPSPTSTRRYSLDHDGEDFPLYANSYSTLVDDRYELDDDDYDDATRIVARSIPYSYNTGTPAISGLRALRSSSNKTAVSRSYGGGVAGVDMDLVGKAETVAKRWRIYSFSAAMLLSDDLPLSEYSIRPYELLELHRAGAYVSLPRTTLPAPEHYDPSQTLHPPMALPSTHTARAYHATTTRGPSPHGPHMPTDGHDPNTSESSDDDHAEMIAGSPYAQPYFDAWVWVLRDGVGGAGGGDIGHNDAVDTEGASARKMQRRGRAKSEAAKGGKGKERARMEREWMEVQPQLRKGVGDDDPEAEWLQRGDRWKKRWLVVREGLLTVRRERRDYEPEECFSIAACAGLYGVEKLPSIMNSTSVNIAPFATPISTDPTSSHTSTLGSVPTPPSSRLSYVICARFRHASSRSTEAEKSETKATRKASQRTGTWLVLKLADETSHEHLLRIFHRLAYSSTVSSSGRPSTSSSAAPSRTFSTRTLRTDFLPNPIPHPLSLSFSAPSPVAHSDDSPTSPFGDMASSEGDDYGGEWVDDASISLRGRRQDPNRVSAKCMGLGRSMGVRFPGWREAVIRKAIRAGQGNLVEDEWGRSDAPVDEETLRGDYLDRYGFVQDDVNDYAAYLAKDDYDSDDPDSDAFSEAEWDGWAYDLDRPKVVEEVENGLGRARRPVGGGLVTPQGSPVSDDLELVTTNDSANSPSTSTLRPRSRSFSTDTHIQTNISPATPSPASATIPITPGTRLRSSTVSAHPRSATFTSGVDSGAPQLRFATASSRAERGLGPEETTSVRTVETNPTGGMRGLMRGLSMRAGRESFLRGLENALDFVEGK